MRTYIPRIPSYIVAVRPLRKGAITDFEVTQRMIRLLLQRVGVSRFNRPRVVICVPSAITAVERRAVKEAAPAAWVRQGGRLQPLAKLLGAPKALVLDVLSARFRKRAAVAGIPFNAAFAGAYDFSKAPDFAALMGEFLDGLPDGGLVMCHPGFVDETLESLDPLTSQREAEHAYLASDRFPTLLAANKVTLS